MTSPPQPAPPPTYLHQGHEIVLSVYSGRWYCTRCDALWEQDVNGWPADVAEATTCPASPQPTPLPLSAARLREVLRAHWLADLCCDHEQQRDRAACACSRVDLGWRENVGAAVDSWITHVLAVLGEPTP